MHEQVEAWVLQTVCIVSKEHQNGGTADLLEVADGIMHTPLRKDELVTAVRALVCRGLVEIVKDQPRATEKAVNLLPQMTAKGWGYFAVEVWDAYLQTDSTLTACTCHWDISDKDYLKADNAYRKSFWKRQRENHK